MFDDASLEDYLDAHGVADQARQYIRRVRRSDPARNVNSHVRNVVCRFASRKMARTIQAESHTGELSAVWTWEFDPATHEFWDQPEAVSVPLVRRDGQRTHQPKTADYLVLQADFVGWVECKPREWLEREVANGDVNYVRDDEGRWHYLPGERVAAEWGIGHVVRLAEDNNRILVDNLSFLEDYLTQDAPSVSPEAMPRIVARFGDGGWVRLDDLLSTHPAVGADDVYAAIAGGVIYANLERDRLSEPSRTHVFRDRLAADAYQLFLRSTTLRGRPDISTVDLAPGHRICWDGAVWTILNIGAAKFFLVDEHDRSIELGRRALDALLGEGRILADPAAPRAQSERVAERLRLASDAQRNRAVSRYRALFPEPGTETAADVPRRTLTEWRRAWRRGEDVYGNGFVGLLPDIHKRGNRTPRLPDCSLEIVAQVIETRYFTGEARTKKSAYGIARLQCRAAGAMVPSEATFLRKVKELATVQEAALARHGRKAAYQIGTWYWRLDDDTPVHGQRPFEIGHLDHTELDLQLIDERFERKTRKCWASALIDAYSRVILALVLTFDPPSYRSCMMLMRECVRRHGRAPATIVVDWGTDFRSEHFEQLTAFLGIHKKHRPKSAPRHGALIERLFKRMNQDVVHQLRGNNQALQKPRGMSKSHDPRERAVWTLGRFRERFEEYVYEVYETQPHEGLGVAPRHAFQTGMRDFGERAHRRIVHDEAFRMVCLPTTSKGRAHVDSAGRVKINGIRYQAPELTAATVVGTDVRVRYDPFDMSLAYASIRNVWITLRSQYARVFCRYSEREIEEASAKIRDANRSVYVNRQISTEILARYLLSLEQDEAVLITGATIKRARATPNTLNASRNPDEVLASDPMDRGDDEKAPDGDLFSDLPIEHYGEFE